MTSEHLFESFGQLRQKTVQKTICLCLNCMQAINEMISSNSIRKRPEGNLVFVLLHDVSSEMISEISLDLFDGNAEDFDQNFN